MSSSPTTSESSSPTSSPSPSTFTPSLPISYIHSSLAPKALATYTPAVKVGSTIYCSGAIGLDPVSGVMVGEDVKSQCHQCLKNMKAVIEEAGGDMTSVVKVTILLSDMSFYGDVNEIYGKYFPVNPPARSCYAVKGLPRNALIEIEGIAIEGKKQ